MDCSYCLEDMGVLFHAPDDPDEDSWYCVDCRDQVTKKMYEIRAQRARDEEKKRWQQSEKKLLLPSRTC
jgi:hypothetical protein